MKDPEYTQAIPKDYENITLCFGDGTIVECEVHGLVETNGKDYVVLYANDGTDEVYIFGYMELNEDEYTIVEISDEEFEDAFNEYERIVTGRGNILYN